MVLASLVWHLTAYQAAFRERPGFPGWSEEQWGRWTADDPAFRPELSFLALIDGRAAGFVTNADDEEAPQDGYLIQVGVHPDRRGQKIGLRLLPALCAPGRRTERKR
ncbi:GNAT family N-acetyltransferase [Thermosporothrix hazakensis]|uniref:N-acetyltransferase domain-containing protein n=1 Tax=Thermosporothrix sp. COM3 TaxID=2490863 RepID=A0A455SI65_9CHLR|nr:GNAT family N-acetyltransferase [Thermosporothrix hazakensis]BBH87068.1 hypothetical protein KTC_18190 [Thermosporothrix sp. COM3]GCE51354.1 hypothetical protein KTH_62230 [Thermosporothrix hazakensis]